MEQFLSKEIELYKKAVGQINIIKFAELVEHPLHSGQQEIAQHFMGAERSKWWFMSILNSRQWGKTRLGSILAASELITPCANVGIVGPSHAIADEMFNLVKRFLQSLKDKGKISKFSADKQSKIIEVPEFQSRLIIASQDSYQDRIIGKKLSMLIIDETFLQEDRKVREIINYLIPTGTTYGVHKDTGMLMMKIVSLSTPRGHPTSRLIGELHMRGMVENTEGYISKRYTIYTNPMLSKEVIEGLRKSMTQTAFNRDYMCQFEVFSAGVFPSFKEEKNVIVVDWKKLRERAEHLQPVVAADWGTADPCAFVMGVFDEKLRKGFILKEFSKSNMLFEDFIKHMKKEEEDMLSRLNVKTEAVRFSDPAEPQGRKIAHKLGYTMVKAFNDRHIGFDSVNEGFEGREVDGIREPDLYIDKSCSNLILQVMGAEFKVVNGLTTSHLKRTDGHHYDLADAVRYWQASIKKLLNKEDPILV